MPCERFYFSFALVKVFGSLSVTHLVKFHNEYLFLAVALDKRHILS